MKKERLLNIQLPITLAIPALIFAIVAAFPRSTEAFYVWVFLWQQSYFTIELGIVKLSFLILLLAIFHLIVSVLLLTYNKMKKLLFILLWALFMSEIILLILVSLFFYDVILKDYNPLYFMSRILE